MLTPNERLFGNSFPELQNPASDYFEHELQWTSWIDQINIYLNFSDISMQDYLFLQFLYIVICLPFYFNEEPENFIHQHSAEMSSVVFTL